MEFETFFKTFLIKNTNLFFRSLKVNLFVFFDMIPDDFCLDIKKLKTASLYLVMVKKA